MSDPPPVLIAGENARIVHRPAPGAPTLVEGKHCPFGCGDLCHSPEICEVPPEARTPAQRHHVAAVLAAVEEDALRTLAEEAARHASPDPAEQAAYAAHWQANLAKGLLP